MKVMYTLKTTDKGLVSIDRSRQSRDSVCRNDYHGGGGVRQGLFLCCNLEPVSVPCQTTNCSRLLSVVYAVGLKGPEKKNIKHGTLNTR